MRPIPLLASSVAAAVAACARAPIRRHPHHRNRRARKRRSAALMRGQPPEGPSQPTPARPGRQAGLHRLLAADPGQGKPGGNRGKDEPSFQPPSTSAVSGPCCTAEPHGRSRSAVHPRRHSAPQRQRPALRGAAHAGAHRLHVQLQHQPPHLDRRSRSRSIRTRRGVTSAPPLARWEGDTLVIETRHLRDSSTEAIWLDENGNPTSDATEVTERWTRPDFAHFHLEMTVTDAKYYARPIRFSRTWAAAPAKARASRNTPAMKQSAIGNIGPGAASSGRTAIAVMAIRSRCPRHRRARRRTASEEKGPIPFGTRPSHAAPLRRSADHGVSAFGGRLLRQQLLDALRELLVLTRAEIAGGRATRSPTCTARTVPLRPTNTVAGQVFRFTSCGTFSHISPERRPADTRTPRRTA